MKNSNYPLVIICGPTAVGKTDCAIAVAKVFDGEIVSADSRQFYREIAIGTAKPSAEELDEIPHHFIDFLDLGEEYSAGKFEKDALRVIEEIHQRGKLPILVGGSGMYIKAVVEGLDPLPADGGLKREIEDFFEKNGLEALQKRLKKIDPEAFQKIDIQNPVRVIRTIEIVELTGKKLSTLHFQKPKDRPFTPIYIGLECPRAELYKKINRRVDNMISAGLVEEAKSVENFRKSQAMQTVGYKEVFPYFEGQYDLAKAVELIKRNTRRYAKRQLTWLRKNTKINWFEYSDYQSIINFIKRKTGLES